jgi:hypothetical protein
MKKELRVMRYKLSDRDKEIVLSEVDEVAKLIEDAAFKTRNKEELIEIIYRSAVKVFPDTDWDVVRMEKKNQDGAEGLIYRVFKELILVGIRED